MDIVSRNGDVTIILVNGCRNEVVKVCVRDRIVEMESRLYSYMIFSCMLDLSTLKTYSIYLVRTLLF